MTAHNQITAEQVSLLDANDPLAHFRDEFVISDAEVCYLDGNSLVKNLFTSSIVRFGSLPNELPSR